MMSDSTNSPWNIEDVIGEKIQTNRTGNEICYLFIKHEIELKI